ncbi:MAG: hypothetical protein H7Y37_18825 [Anaerolineae bacterium]|nr:hypothetical protein [Gloeobacterales cyanobacterium ES-bin-313]
MISTLSWRWLSLISALLIVFMDLAPLRSATLTDQFSDNVRTDCLICTLARQFPSLRQQLQGVVSWTQTTRRFDKQTVAGLAATAFSDIHHPTGLKPPEQEAWLSMAKRCKLQLFLPKHYNGSIVVERGAVRIEVQPLGSSTSKAELQGKTLVYKNAYPSTDSLQVVNLGRSEEFLYLRNSTAPRVFDYRVRVGQGVQMHSIGRGVAFLDAQGRGVLIERPWLVDSSGRRSDSAVHLQLLEGGKRLRLTVDPEGLRYPLVVDPTWSATGELGKGREFHTATLLPNGTVLVVGGQNSSSYQKSAEIYSPQTGTWTNTGSMSMVHEHTATLLNNGKVLVVGGFDNGSAELYDSSTGTWSVTGSMATPRWGHAASLLSNGKLLVTGGRRNTVFGSKEFIAGGAGSVDLDSSEIYNPQTGMWTATASMKTPRFRHTSTLLANGKVLIAGGQNNGGKIGTPVDLSSAELYDPATNMWNTTVSMNETRWGHTATLLGNGKVLIVGRYNNSISSNGAEVYNLQTGTWSATSSMMTPRFGQVATLLTSGKVLVTGGGIFNSKSMGGVSYLSSAELYDPTTDAWTITASMSKNRARHTATLLKNGKVLVVGGNDIIAFLTGVTSFSSAELYNPDITPDTSVTSNPNLAVPSRPTISSLAIVDAPFSQAVSISGNNLLGATSVMIDGIAARLFFVNSNTQINAILMSGEMIKIISVTTPAGTATFKPIGTQNPSP